LWTLSRADAKGHASSLRNDVTFTMLLRFPEDVSQGNNLGEMSIKCYITECLDESSGGYCYFQFPFCKFFEEKLWFDDHLRQEYPLFAMDLALYGKKS